MMIMRPRILHTRPGEDDHHHDELDGDIDDTHDHYDVDDGVDDHYDHQFLHLLLHSRPGDNDGCDHDYDLDGDLGDHDDHDDLDGKPSRLSDGQKESLQFF